MAFSSDYWVLWVEKKGRNWAESYSIDYRYYSQSSFTFLTFFFFFKQIPHNGTPYAPTSFS